MPGAPMRESLARQIRRLSPPVRRAGLSPNVRTYRGGASPQGAGRGVDVVRRAQPSLSQPPAKGGSESRAVLPRWEFLPTPAVAPTPPTGVLGTGWAVVAARCQVGPLRGSRTTTAVSVDRRPAYASSFGSTATHRCQSQSRSSPAAARARTTRGCWRANRTTASGCAARFSHHAGRPSSQPFIASATRLGPSSR
jgi:hypothetical protein